jgi:hypothetical protein
MLLQSVPRCRAYSRCLPPTKQKCHVNQLLRQFLLVLPPTNAQAVASVDELLAPGSCGADWLVARPTEHYVMGTWAPTYWIHVMHCIAIVQPSLRYPVVHYEGNVQRLVIDGVSSEKVTVDAGCPHV